MSRKRLIRARRRFLDGDDGPHRIPDTDSAQASQRHGCLAPAPLKFPLSETLSKTLSTVRQISRQSFRQRRDALMVALNTYQWST